MKRVKLTVAYDGTNYCGWQVQPNGITIESELNRCLSDLLGEEIRVTGASRTDAGVHARGNVAVFDTAARMPAERISYALNTRLPEDIRIQESREVPADFHPRFCETRKTYEYRICNRRFPDPCSRLYSLFYYWDLDVDRMRKAASYLVGTHDFTSFCTQKPEVTNRVRTIYGIEIWREPERPQNREIVCEPEHLREPELLQNQERPQTSEALLPAGTALPQCAGKPGKDFSAHKESPANRAPENICAHPPQGGMIIVRICGNGFLYNMVRIIVGTLLRIGSGMQEPEEMAAILAGRDRSLAGDTARPQGLTLVSIQYPNGEDTACPCMRGSLTS